MHTAASTRSAHRRISRLRPTSSRRAILSSHPGSSQGRLPSCHRSRKASVVASMHHGEWRYRRPADSPHTRSSLASRRSAPLSISAPFPFLCFIFVCASVAGARAHGERDFQVSRSVARFHSHSKSAELTRLHVGGGQVCSDSKYVARNRGAPQSTPLSPLSPTDS